MKKGAWKKISSKIVHQNPWYALREDDVIRPDGKEGKYFYTAEKNSVAIIAEDEDDGIYLVGQSRYAIGNLYSWEVVLGGIEKGQTPLEAAKEELEEEIGMKAEEWIDLGYFYPLVCYCSEKCSCWLARKLTKTQTRHEGTEDITAKKESLERVIEMVKKNEIACGLSLSTIVKYLSYKEKINKY